MANFLYETHLCTGSDYHCDYHFVSALLISGSSDIMSHDIFPRKSHVLIFVLCFTIDLQFGTCSYQSNQFNVPLCTLARLYVVPVCRPFAGWQGLYLICIFNLVMAVPLIACCESCETKSGDGSYNHNGCTMYASK